MKKRWQVVALLVAVAGVVGMARPVQAMTVQRERTAIKKIMRKDLNGVGGRWSARVTRIGKRPLSVTTGNQRVKAPRSASTIKVFVMLTIYRHVQTHQLRLTANDQRDLKLMIHNSDNAAANRLIKRAGGFRAVNQTAKRYGFHQTTLRRYMLDTNALRHGRDNYTSVNDLTRFLSLTKRHRLLGRTYDQHMLTLLRGCRNHSKLPKLVQHATVYNKTGEYPDKGVQNDAALFKTKHGTYSVVVMAQSGQATAQYRGMNRLGRDVVRYLDQHR